VPPCDRGVRIAVPTPRRRPNERRDGDQRERCERHGGRTRRRTERFRDDVEPERRERRVGGLRRDIGIPGADDRVAGERDGQHGRGKRERRDERHAGAARGPAHASTDGEHAERDRGRRRDVGAREPLDRDERPEPHRRTPVRRETRGEHHDRRKVEQDRVVRCGRDPAPEQPRRREERRGGDDAAGMRSGPLLRGGV
jgi:hypothetical protein